MEQDKKTENKDALPAAEYVLKSVTEVLEILKTSPQGLTNEQVAERLKNYGPNELVAKKKKTWLKRFFLKFASPLIIILLITGTLSLTFGDKRSAVIIYLMIVLSIVMDFFQEYKSEKTVEKLKEKVVTKVEVLRSGKKECLKVSELVPGDIVCLSVGSIIPADARIISSDDFFVNESSLTGEAFPVGKDFSSSVEFKNEISAQKNLVFLGTNVVNGYAQAVVINTGFHTVFGKIAKNLEEAEEETEFEKGVRGFGVLITKIISSLVIIIFFLNSFVAGHSLFDSLMFSLALAVGLTPELLPMIMSITLARGSLSMSKHGVIVKRLNSIHDFGGMNILCTDKTGTLTENNIELVKHVDIYGNNSDKLLDFAYLNSYFQSGIENPLDDAVLKVNDKIVIKEYQKIDEIPFDFIRRRLSIVVEKEREYFLISKGAPEEILTIVNSYEDNGQLKDFTAEMKEAAQKEYNSLSADGFRVLALGYKKVTVKNKYQISDEGELILLGFMAFLDPPKYQAKEAIDILEAQGIEIKIITGDNDLVTKKICSEVDVKVKGILIGEELEKMSEEELKQRVNEVTIFARISPEQKGRIVSSLRSNGFCVGYMGDGINDALPLKRADVGISVNNAVDVAKEAADLILLTNDLKVLSLGVTEGRKTFGNTMKYILMGLSSNFGNMFSVAVASFLLPFLPMLPIQILLNNFLYDFSQITIPTDNVDPEYVEKPKRWNNKLIKRFMILFGPISSLFDIITFVVMYFVFSANASLFQTGWFLESLATQTLVIFIIRTRLIPFVQSRPGKYLVFSVVSIVVLAFILPFTSLGSYFGFTPISLSVFGAITLIVLVYLLLVQKLKALIYKKYFA
ncbi:MAG: magnesium-translocating P-type ATPase [Planctomycetes bacterium]|jgi:Mg2+-importing ATPase|nr:magnesium-translocating P-type ATPase [Planctomycetota bacterium]